MEEFASQTKVVEVLNKVFCNKCAIFIDPGTFSGIDSHRAKIFATWGYGSPKDGEDHSLDICESCYDEFVDSCKIKPTINGEKGLMS